MVADAVAAIVGVHRGCLKNLAGMAEVWRAGKHVQTENGGSLSLLVAITIDLDGLCALRSPVPSLY